MNIALSADAGHEGGRLIGLFRGEVQALVRGEGGATVHSSSLLQYTAAEPNRCVGRPFLRQRPIPDSRVCAASIHPCICLRACLLAWSRRLTPEACCMLGRNHAASHHCSRLMLRDRARLCPVAQCGHAYVTRRALLTYPRALPCHHVLFQAALLGRCDAAGLAPACSTHSAQSPTLWHMLCPLRVWRRRRIAFNHRHASCCWCQRRITSQHSQCGFRNARLIASTFNSRPVLQFFDRNPRKGRRDYDPSRYDRRWGAQGQGQAPARWWE